MNALKEKNNKTKTDANGQKKTIGAIYKLQHISGKYITVR